MNEPAMRIASDAVGTVDANQRVSGCDMAISTWQPISTAPFNRDLELAVLEGTDVHALVVCCRRGSYGWVDAATGKRIEVDPTHWREWQQPSLSYC
jgi:hypothetical protein